MNLIEFFKRTPEFSDLSDEDIASVEKTMQVKDYEDGHKFIKEGATGDAIYFILSGQVSAQQQKEAGTFFEIKRLRPGEMFGMISAIDSRERLATCKAMGPVTVASLTHDQFDRLFSQDSPLPHAFKFIVARQLARDLRSIIGLLRSDTSGHPSNGPDRRNDTDRRSGIDRRNDEPRRTHSERRDQNID